MKSPALCFVVGALAVTSVAGRRHALMDNAAAPASSDGLQLGPPPSFFTQKQDHFDPANTHTWQQAYYVNATYWEGPAGGAPVFLCVGGEGPPLDGSVVVASPHCNVAVEWLQETKALMLAVEHRYYGCHNSSACPYKLTDKKPLQYLSSRQAIEDLAQFHAHASEEYNLTAANKWVSFGGSYPGMLAGWFRVRHPELVHASVASSAPVVAILDMRGYNDVTAQAYAVESVGGSAACTKAIADGHARIGELMNTTDGRKTIAAAFRGVSAESLVTRAGQRNFAGEGVASFPAQSNDPSCTDAGCNIALICDVMTNTTIGDEVARLAALRNSQLESGVLELPARGSDDDDRKKKEMQKTGLEYPDLDYWGYQTCTEFGFYQTCEVGSQCFFTQGLDLLADNDAFCQTAHGISQAEIQANIDSSNAFYGAGHPNATRILYPNGEVDPWKSQGILKAPSPELPVMLVAGASHHAWTHPTLPTDQASVVQARLDIKKQVAAWLQEE